MHALQEAWRVLKPDGILIDLRPATEQSRVGITRAGQFSQIGETLISFDDFMAADQAFNQVIQMGRFTPRHSDQFLCTLITPSYKQLREWIYDPEQPDSEQHSDWLVNQVRQAMKAEPSPVKMMISHQIVLRVLDKREPI